MGYTESTLISGEKILVTGKVHWYFYILPVTLVIFGLMLVLSMWAVENTDEAASALGGAQITAIIIIALGLFGILRNYLTEYAFTTKRLVYKRGIIARKVFELNINKIESANIDEGIIGRMLGFGILKISGTGGNNEPIKKLAKPIKFRQAIQEELEKIGK